MSEEPRLGPGHKRLGAFVGTWATEGEIKGGPSGPRSKVRAIDIYEWLPGGFFLLHKGDSHMPDGRTQGIEVIGYDPASDAYSMHSFDSAGRVAVMRASVEREEWTFEGPSLRFTGGFRDGGDTWAGTWTQRSSEGAEWFPWMNITLSKVK